MSGLQLAGAALAAVAVACGATLRTDDSRTASGIDIQIDPSHCGAVGNACRAVHARAVCSAGRCEIAACEEGWADCDGSGANGCEAGIATDPERCGSCLRTCQLDNALAACVDGECVLGACLPGFADCDGAAASGCETSTARNPRHCGACGNACPAGEMCAAGTCTSECPPPLAKCGDLCVDPTEDVANCGACGRACRLDHALAACGSGTCRVARCHSGSGDCDGIPENGCETDTARDPDHCGACDRPCRLSHAEAACRGGNCRLAGCELGWEDCDGEESNGCETNTKTSAESCGACGDACHLENAAARCAAGACAVGDCRAGFGDCDDDAGNGCETDTRTNPRHCGACHRPCPGGMHCVDGDCAEECPPPHVVCRQACVHLDRDATHCGACGVACRLEHAAAGCVAGACRVERCLLGWGDCDGDPGNGCETSLRRELDCGSCGHRCPAGYRCSTGPARLAACAYWP